MADTKQPEVKEPTVIKIDPAAEKHIVIYGDAQFGEILRALRYLEQQIDGMKDRIIAMRKQLLPSYKVEEMEKLELYY